MLVRKTLFTLSVLSVVSITEAVEDKCPKGDYACLDVMNSSQCIAQVVNDKNTKNIRDALIKCVEYEGTVTNLTGATKYCRCLGCHTPAINSVLSELFPPPCA